VLAVNQIGSIATEPERVKRMAIGCLVAGLSLVKIGALLGPPAIRRPGWMPSWSDATNDARGQHVDVCVVTAGMQNGCAAIALGSGLWAGGYGPTTAAAIQYASSRLPAVESPAWSARHSDVTCHLPRRLRSPTRATDTRGDRPRTNRTSAPSLVFGRLEKVDKPQVSPG
jgi:hypothetical protein